MKKKDTISATIEKYTSVPKPGSLTSALEELYDHFTDGEVIREARKRLEEDKRRVTSAKKPGTSV